MIRITVDDRVLDEIRRAGTPVHLCDSQGNEVAVAWPGLSQYAGLEDMPIPTPDELKAILSEKPRFSIDQVMQKLEGR